MRTNEQFVKELQIKSPTIIPLESYKGAKEKIKFQCKICGYIFITTADSVLRGSKCRKCNGTAKYTTEEFKQQLNDIHPNLEILGEYVNANTKIKTRCKICNYTWDVTPASLKASKGSGCPSCYGNIPKTHETYQAEMKEKFPKIKLLDKYENSKLDWALPFQRTGDFPLDRSTMFSSYADAVKYAAGDMTDPDERGLCGTSYIGQIITVFENDVVTSYEINADRTLKELGSGGSGKTQPDEKAIVTNADEKLTLGGYEEAESGKMPVKSEDGLTWETPASVEEVERAVTDARTAASNAQTFANIAKAKAAYVERKIWFGSIAEYNALEEIYEDTIYIILDGVMNFNE